MKNTCSRIKSARAARLRCAGSGGDASRNRVVYGAVWLRLRISAGHRCPFTRGTMQRHTAPHRCVANHAFGDAARISAVATLHARAEEKAPCGMFGGSATLRCNSPVFLPCSDRRVVRMISVWVIHEIALYGAVWLWLRIPAGKRRLFTRCKTMVGLPSGFTACTPPGWLARLPAKPCTLHPKS